MGHRASVLFVGCLSNFFCLRVLYIDMDTGIIASRAPGLDVFRFHLPTSSSTTQLTLLCPSSALHLHQRESPHLFTHSLSHPLPNPPSGGSLREPVTKHLEHWRQASRIFSTPQMIYHAGKMFANCLAQPGRGGSKRQSLSSIISSQINRRGARLNAPSQSDPLSDHGERKTRVRNKKEVHPDEAAVRRASLKLQEGDVRGAVRCINSDESLCPLDENVLLALKAKHPPAPSDRRPYPLPSSPCLPTRCPSCHPLFPTCICWWKRRTSAPTS